MLVYPNVREEWLTWCVSWGRQEKKYLTKGHSHVLGVNQELSGWSETCWVERVHSAIRLCLLIRGQVTVRQVQEGKPRHPSPPGLPAVPRPEGKNNPSEELGVCHGFLFQEDFSKKNSKEKKYLKRWLSSNPLEEYWNPPLEINQSFNTWLN